MNGGNRRFQKILPLHRNCWTRPSGQAKLAYNNRHKDLLRLTVRGEETGCLARIACEQVDEDDVCELFELDFHRLVSVVVSHLNVYILKQSKRVKIDKGLTTKMQAEKVTILIVGMTQLMLCLDVQANMKRPQGAKAAAKRPGKRRCSGVLDPILDRVWFVDEPHEKDISCSADDTSDDQCEEDNTHKADREVIHVDIDDWEGFEERVLKGEGHISASSFRNKVTSKPRSLHKCRISALYTH